MVGKAVRTILFVAGAGTISMTSLALPVARAAIAAVPVSDARSLSCSELRAMLKRTHAEFGNIAAELACSYLKRFEAGEGTSGVVRARAEHGPLPTKPLDGEPVAYALESER
jgi:hypothetical protein